MTVEAESEGPAGAAEDCRHGVHLRGQVVYAGQVGLLQLEVGAPVDEQRLCNVRQLVCTPL